jgi:penicillin-binding protein 1A
VRQTAYDMGITSHLDAYPAEGLGGLTHGVSPLEMTRAYMTVNTGGYRVRPVAVTKVVFPNGKVDTSLAQQERKKIFTDGQTYEAIKAMEGNIQRGTGTRAQLSSCTAAGKTGTTSSFTDAWFDGFTTGLNTAVWVGYPNRNISMTAVPGYGEMFGGLAPALIWHDFMEVAAKGRCQDFPKPTTAFVGAPFFGKYASTGAPGKDPSVNGYNGPNAYGGQTTTPQPGAGGSPKAGKGGGTTYDPNLYESPPQKAPKIKPPKAVPAAPGQTANAGNGAG